MFLVFQRDFLFAKLEKKFPDFILKMILSRILGIVQFRSFHLKKDHNDLLDIKKNEIKLIVIVIFWQLFLI